MGTTLTHNVYLPDEGERNCYSGLAANWQILDDAVGAIAGKANASHTHGNISNDGAIGSTSGLPVITGTDGVLTTGTFGNTSGTFCEGNDSRLSDARTPVAHTHTKSDVTDLLNSNFIPSVNNSYDLGSSSYQWNNIYAKGYFYNGVAWGLDKANVWTGSNQFNTSVRFSGQTGINFARGGNVGTLPSSVMYYGFQNALDSNDNVFDRIRSYIGTAGTNFQEHVKYAWNDLTKYVTINYWINADGSDSEYKLSVKRLVPAASNTTDLGTSTNQWKSLNGVNPGALSLPDYSKAQNLDVSAQGLNWSTTGARIAYTPTVSGWLQITASGGSGSYMTMLDSGTTPRAGQRITGDGIDRLFLTHPVVENHTYWIYIVSSSIETARIIPCLGNVS